MLECSEPPANPVCPSYPTFKILPDVNIPIIVNKDDYAWLLSRTLCDNPSLNSEAPTDTDDRSRIPGWSAYNSLIEDPLPVTRVSAPPLLGSPVHEWGTLLTILMRAQNINTSILGIERKTVISLDMSLYLQAKRLQTYRNDLKHIILRPGELHIVMAMLRTIGAYIENSGIDACWIEAEMYGPSTVKQILDGNHVRRGVNAHITTLQALFSLYQKALFQKNEDVLRKLKHLANKLAEAFTNNASIENEHSAVVQAIDALEIEKIMSAFENSKKDKPMFQVFRQYMSMVMEMLCFIKAVRRGDWQMHLEALEVFTKYFFAHDRLNYARMIPVYLAEMASIESSDPDIHHEFLQGNWVVNKNESVSFCAIGADHALEHINRSMKVSGGLVGITLNEVARTKFFLIAPELARLSEQAKEMAGLPSGIQNHHHNLTHSTIKREHQDIQRLASTIQNFTNPFSDDNTDLFNLVTKVVMSNEVKKDLCEQKEIGKKLLKTYVDERIKTTKVNVWSRLKKRKLLTWKSANKKMKIKTDDKVVELQEDRSLFARMMMVCKRRPEIDIKEAVGVYEFSVVPRSLFASDGTMLCCSTKSVLLHILERQNTCAPTDDNTTSDVTDAPYKVDVVDGMAELQALDKPAWIRNCAQLADHFTSRLLRKYDGSNEIRVIFDRYDVESSLKTATRVRRQGKHKQVTHITLMQNH